MALPGCWRELKSTKKAAQKLLFVILFNRFVRFKKIQLCLLY